ncbi:thiamine pyrophosphate-binding protein [Porticoccaceae bacterium]|nr:thiamine pyrophosphate-binding protein [Porticoccaceae bacterium]
MNKSGAWLTQYALEQLGISHTFGIPGVENAEIYDQLNQSQQIIPILVNHEMNAAFMADAVSRTGAGTVGTMLIVSGSGVTHAISGIGEAYLAGIPLLIIAGAQSTNTEQSGYPTIAAKEILKPLTKAIFSIGEHHQIVETLYTAYRVATSDRPGPVFVEIPIDIQVLAADIEEPLPLFTESTDSDTETISDAEINAVAKKLLQAKSPGIIVGWGAVDTQTEVIALAQQIGAPVCTTLAGVSSFPAQNPLHTGMIFGPAAVPSAEQAFKDCDCLLAIGTNLDEADTASGSAELPENVICITSGKNHSQKNHSNTQGVAIALHGNIQQIITDLLYKLQGQQSSAPSKKTLVEDIESHKALFKKEWLGHNSKGRVNPAVFFDKLHAAVSDDSIIITDDGLHTYLAAELMPINSPRSFISPSSFNAMGYCMPAVNAAKLVNPDKQVIGILGDGAMLMSGNEALTAVRENLGTIYCIFNDGKLSRINHSRRVSDSQSTCTKLGNINWGAFADSIECGYIPIRHNNEIEVALRHALETAAHNQPVFLDISIDYSRQSNYAQGVEKTHAARFSGGHKLGMLGRALVRKLTG